MSLTAPAAIGLGVGSFIDWLIGSETNSDTQQALLSALSNAQKSIETAASRGLSYQAPYLRNADQDYTQLRGMVNSGYFQQPLNRGFTSQQAQPQSFSFNPASGTANFAAFQPGAPGTFTPPSLPAFPTFTPPPAAVPQTPPPVQQTPKSTGPLDAREALNLFNQLTKGSQTPNPMDPTPNNTPYTPPGVRTSVGAPKYDPRLGIVLDALNMWKQMQGRSPSTIPTFGGAR